MNRNLKLYSISFLVIVVCFVCCRRKSSVSEKELLSYTLDPSNGLLKSVKKEDDLRMDILYRPSELMLAQLIRGDKELTSKQIDSVRNNLLKYNYFLLRLSYKEKEIMRSYIGNELMYNKSIDYLSSGLGKNVKMVSGSDTLAAKDFIHTNTFGSATTDILIAFENKPDMKQDEDISFILNDTFFGFGFSTVEFKANDLKAVPIIDIKTINL